MLFRSRSSFILPGGGTLNSGRMKLDLKMLPPEKPELACVFATPLWLAEGKLQAPGFGADYYCFDPKTLVLRMTYTNQLAKEFSQLWKTQGRYLARRVEVTASKQKRFTAFVEKIDAVDPADAAFSPPADATLERWAPSRQRDSQGDITKGLLVKKTQPVYPATSKIAGEQGVVVLAALIGTDGKVHDLDVLASPSSMLAASALDCVKSWEYKPYFLNGTAVEVETIVNVIYTLGR